MPIRLSTFLEGRLATSTSTWWADDILSLAAVPDGSRDAYLAVVRNQLPWIDRWASQNLRAKYRWYATDIRDVVTSYSVCISRGGLLIAHPLDSLCGANNNKSDVYPAASGLLINDPSMYSAHLGQSWGGIGLSAISRKIYGKPSYWPNGSLLSYQADPATYEVKVEGGSDLWDVPLGRATWTREWLSTGNYWPQDWPNNATDLLKRETVPCGPTDADVTGCPTQGEVISAPSLVERLEVHRVGSRVVAFNLAKSSTFVDYMRVMAGRLTGSDLVRFNDQLTKLSLTPNRVFGVFYNDGFNPFDLYPSKHPLRKNATAIWNMTGTQEGINFDKMHSNFQATIGQWVPIVIGDEDGLLTVDEEANGVALFAENTESPGTYVSTGGLTDTYQNFDAAIAAARLWYKRGGEVMYPSLSSDDILRMDTALLEPTLHGLNDDLEGWTQIVQSFIGSLISLPNADNTKVMLAALGPVVIG